ncbi:MAG: hypothetical protein ACTSUE_25425 [Promethearchaeota archaeon]
MKVNGDILGNDSKEENNKEENNKEENNKEESHHHVVFQPRKSKYPYHPQER